MPKKGLPKHLGSKPVIILLSGLISTVFFILITELWRADIHSVFIGMGGDSVLELMGIQNLLETGTRNRATRLGGVSGQFLYNYPVSDFLNYAIMWIISLFTKNAAVIMNVFYFLGYPLASMTATWALLELDVSRIVSVFAGVPYAFLSFHIMRNQNHLLLSAYFIVPLGILAAIWLMNRKADFHFLRKDPFREKIRKNRRFLLSLLFCLLISSTGLYYAFFACFFLLVATARLLFADRKLSKSVTTGCLLIAVVVSGVLLNYLPTIWFGLTGGESGESLSRPGEGAEIYGLKLFNLLLPTIAHRFPGMESYVNEALTTLPVTNENSTVSLGLIGSIGLLILLVAPILKYRNELSDRGETLKTVALFMYGGIFLSMQGGLGALVCRLLIHGIRAYNRIVVFLFFFALIAVALSLDLLIFGPEKTWLADKVQGNGPAHGTKTTHRLKPRSRQWLALFLIPLLPATIYDQVPFISVQNYEINIAADQDMRTFFQEAEAGVPEGTLVYVLPFTSFPEAPMTYGASPYSQLSGYLNTKTLRWSYGAMVGTSSSNWASKTANLPAAEMLTELKARGYGAIYVDLLNYPDDTLQKLSDELIALTGQEPVISTSGLQIFIPISD